MTVGWYIIFVTMYLLIAIRLCKKNIVKVILIGQVLDEETYISRTNEIISLKKIKNWQIYTNYNVLEQVHIL